MSAVALRAITSDSEWSVAVLSAAGAGEGADDAAGSGARAWQPAASSASAAVTSARGFGNRMRTSVCKTAPASPFGEAGASPHATERACVSVPDHRGAEEAQHLADRVGDRRRRAAGEQQADRARVRAHVLDHQRARIAAVQELRAAVPDHDLAGERL